MYIMKYIYVFMAKSQLKLVRRLTPMTLYISEPGTRSGHKIIKRTNIINSKLRAAEVIELCFPRIYKECPLRRTFDPLRCTSAAS